MCAGQRVQFFMMMEGNGNCLEIMTGHLPSWQRVKAWEINTAGYPPNTQINIHVCDDDTW